MEFKAGDVVKLKSGGPTMTVKQVGKFGYDEHESAECQWFDGTKPMSETFPLTSLNKGD